ncbi:DNA-binding transcriptional response regulator [Peredibacter starrii]|uniref:Response regulatory domain-containing protein n=1 Tax=Peredibacter starrii TaxID=28202 RepID=A0AAX4HSA3_9BACT|nr:hypothetical protein [Peredibacter starrii]WPU65784.1 hypothetical protein SOO65_03395 [Peredibacter starrii]
MNRYDGNTILIVDIDRVYGTQLAEVLASQGARTSFGSSIAEAKELLLQFDFDIVISNYYLTDGIIFQLIDWCEKNIRTLPIFTAMGNPLPGELDLLRKQSIADVFSKGDRNRMFTGISNLLFDFKEFQGNLQEMISPSEVMIELKVKEERMFARPIEIADDCIYLLLKQQFQAGMFGIMNFSLREKKEVQHFVIPGFFAGEFAEGQQFRINRTYQGHWKIFLDHMQDKQMNISNFLKKAAGH